MRISDWSSDVCSSDLKSAWRLAVDRAVILAGARLFHTRFLLLIRFARTGNGNAPTPLQRLRDRFPRRALHLVGGQCRRPVFAVDRGVDRRDHFGAGLHPVVAQSFGLAKLPTDRKSTELQSLIRISYAVFCLQ